MKTWIIVRKDDMKIMGSYEAEQKDDSSANRSYLVAEPLCAHVELTEELDMDCLAATLVPESGDPMDPENYVPEHYALSEDADLMAAKTQRDRDSKLALMREMREDKMKAADHMVNDLVTGDRTDTAAVQLYRQQLKDITDNYKDSEDDMMGTDALDSLEMDLSDLNWPTAP